MIKVIETNLSIDDKGNIVDHQSRVIDVENWGSFINEISKGETIIRDAVLGHMSGCTIPKQAKIENLIWDDKHLSCDVYNFAGRRTKKLVYKI